MLCTNCVDSLSLFKACCESAGILECGDEINDLNVLDLTELTVKLIGIDAPAEDDKKDKKAAKVEEAPVVEEAPATEEAPAEEAAAE